MVTLCKRPAESRAVEKTAQHAQRGMEESAQLKHIKQSVSHRGTRDIHRQSKERIFRRSIIISSFSNQTSEGMSANFCS